MVCLIGDLLAEIVEFFVWTPWGRGLSTSLQTKVDFVFFGSFPLSLSLAPWAHGAVVGPSRQRDWQLIAGLLRRPLDCLRLFLVVFCSFLFCVGDLVGDSNAPCLWQLQSGTSYGLLVVLKASDR